MTLIPFKPRPKGARIQKGLSKAEHLSPVLNGYVKSADGTQLFYSSEGTGPPLVFCYGLVCSSLHWTYQIDYFQSTHQVVWFDYRGHQNSEIPKDLSTLTIQTMALDLKCILDELEIFQAVFLGHSMGVNVVLEFYKQFPRQVAGIVLANGTPQRPLDTLFHQNKMVSVFKGLNAIYQRFPKAFSKLWKSQKSNPLLRTLVALGGFNPHLTPQKDIDVYVDQVMETDPGILLYLIESYQHYDALPWLETIRIPSLILAGEKDRIVPLQQQELMHQLIPNSHLEVLRHGSHCPQMDLPELVNWKIETFLKEIQWIGS